MLEISCFGGTFASGKEEKKVFMNRSSKRGLQKKTIMKEERKNEIMMLKYSIDRYQAMGNGPMCQLLNQKMRKLQMKGMACN